MMLKSIMLYRDVQHHHAFQHVLNTFQHDDAEKHHVVQLFSASPGVSACTKYFSSWCWKASCHTVCFSITMLFSMYSILFSIVVLKSIMPYCACQRWLADSEKNLVVQCFSAPCFSGCKEVHSPPWLQSAAIGPACGQMWATLSPKLQMLTCWVRDSKRTRKWYPNTCKDWIWNIFSRQWNWC